MNTELVIPYRKLITKEGLGGIALMIFFSCFLIYMSIDWQNAVGYYPSLFIRSLLIFYIISLLVAAINAFYLVKSPEPALILNKSGIRVKYYDLIPWENIEEVGSYCLPTTPIEAIGIRIKALSLVAKNASWAGKSTLFWARILGYYYQITVMGIDIEHEEVVAFARQFLK